MGPGSSGLEIVGPGAASSLADVAEASVTSCENFSQLP